MGMIIRLGPLQVDLLDPSSSGLPTVLQQTAAEFLAFRRRRERFDCKSAWSLSQPGMSSAWQDEWLRLTMLLFFFGGKNWDHCYYDYYQYDHWYYFAH